MNEQILDGLKAGLNERFYGGITTATVTLTSTTANIVLAVTALVLADATDNAAVAKITGSVKDKNGLEKTFSFLNSASPNTITKASLPAGFDLDSVDSIITIATENGYKNDLGVYNHNAKLDNNVSTYKYRNDQGREPSGLRA